MKAVIVSYDCTDHDPIDKWIPEDPLNVDFWMNFKIGHSRPTGDDFQVRVVTQRNVNTGQKIEHAIVLTSYSWSGVVAAVELILEKCQGRDWGEISEKLSKMMYWEFDGYKVYKKH